MLTCNAYTERVFQDGSAWQDRNRITFSKVLECEIEKYQAPTFSIKYVLSGAEHYFLNGKNFSVGAGKFLFVNSESPVDCFVRANRPVAGFCIHLVKDLLEDILTTTNRSDAWLLDHCSHRDSLPAFEELIFNASDSELGQYIQYLVSRFDPVSNSIDIEEEEMFRQLGFYVLNLQQSFVPVQQLKVIRSSTRIELSKRLAIAKEMLDDLPAGSPDMNYVAQAACLSPAHFYRNFRKAFGISPYQYAVKKKMEQAVALLQKGETPITDIAMALGFADLPAFSKQFKKTFGTSPSHYSLLQKRA